MRLILASIAASSLLAGLAPAQSTRHYDITDLGTVPGGTDSYATVINNSGLISGHATGPDGTVHAVIWQKGPKMTATAILDIGKDGLAGPNSIQNSIAWGVNERGEAVGQAQTSNPDPYREDTCGSKALGLPSLGTTCLPFLWRKGVMTSLPLLTRGNNGVANSINNAGEAAGSAENGTNDPNCPAPQVLHFKPVIWENGKVRELGTFPGDATFPADPNGIAFGISDNGKVAGASGICTTFDPIGNTSLLSLHSLLWQDGKLIDLGNLGGQFGNSASAVNNRGQVVGSSDLKGDTVFHAFRWTQDSGIKSLDPLSADGARPADKYSVAISINDSGDATGISIDESFMNLHAVLWENGEAKAVDLNTRIAANPSGLFLQLAEHINSLGEIVGFAQTRTGQTHAYLATPTHGAGDKQDVTSPMILSEYGRKLFQQRLRRFGIRLMGPR